MNLKQTEHGFEVFEDDDTTVRAWRDDERWNVRVLKYGCIHGFSCHRDKDVAVKNAVEKCDNKCRFVYRMLKRRFEAF